MEKRGTRYVIAFCVSVITGVLLQCLYEEMGGPVLSTLVPVNGSAWEQGKLCFWPYLAGALLIWRLGDGQDSRGGHCVLLLVMPLMMSVTSPEAIITLSASAAVVALEGWNHSMSTPLISS